MSQTNGNGHRKDVLIQAPVAHLGVGAIAPGAVGPSLDNPPSAEELCSIYYASIKQLKAEKSELSDFCRGVSSLCLSLTKMLVDHGLASDEGEVTVPKWLHQRMLGGSITVRQEVNGDIAVVLREQGHERIVPGL